MHFFLPFTALLSLAFTLRAAEPAQETPGHSSHGQSFSEGPRRFATLIGGTGNVSFPVSTKKPEAQQFFDQGVGQLHGFWYYEAERSFRQVLHLDPECVMAYWGMAMANIENETRAREMISRAMPKIALVTEREQLWIKSLEKFYAEKKDDKARKDAARQLVKDWEEIAEKFSDDLEAKAFVVCMAWRNAYRQGVEIGSRLSVDALAEAVLAKNPKHPVHHYVIHLWDKEKAERALHSAAECGPCAPNIAHMWHMPGHIYAELQRWHDSAWQQEAAVRMDHKFMMQQSTMPDQIHNYAHNSEWFCRNLNTLGRAADAIAVSKNMIEQPLIPRSSKVTDKPDQKWDENGTAYSLGRQRLFDTLLRWEMWDRILDLSSTPYLEPGERFEGKIRQAHLTSLAHYGKGDLAKAREAVKALEKYETDTRVERIAAADAAEKDALKADKKAEETNRAMADAMLPFTKKLEQIPPLREELRIWDALAENRLDEAKSLRDKLKKVPEERLLKIDWLLGKKDEVVKRAKELATNNKDSVYSQAVLAEVLFKAEKMDEAKKAFADLRRICAHSDTDLPILVRLRPLADACEAQGDWREKPVAAADIGPRPPQSDFGPLLWGPTMAPQWQVEHPDKGTISHSSMAGQPHIVIFFLGKGCAHCIQQLHAFEPKHAQFAAAGLPILTMSTDTLDGVRDTVKLAKENGGFPFPIHADPTMAAFKAFNCFDDFENKPLHGTFLMDAQGRIRWQHISYEPFMEADFLLKEAQRLLKLAPAEAGVARKS